MAKAPSIRPGRPDAVSFYVSGQMRNISPQAVVKPGADLALMNGLLHLLTGNGKVDADFIASYTEGWEAMPEFLADYLRKPNARRCLLRMIIIVTLPALCHPRESKGLKHKMRVRRAIPGQPKQSPRLVPYRV